MRDIYGCGSGWDSDIALRVEGGVLGLEWVTIGWVDIAWGGMGWN